MVRVYLSFTFTSFLPSLLPLASDRGGKIDTANKKMNTVIEALLSLV